MANMSGTRKGLCRDCFYWHSQSGLAPVTECRKNAPIATDRMVCRTALWPTTSPEDWCGEFKAGTA